jgi:hypothetical protein
MIIRDTPNYALDLDQFGNLTIHNRHNGKSIYLQSDDATQFEHETGDVDELKADLFDYACSQYDEVMN